ncbi:MAG: hypothetical protein ACLQNV_15835 [Steroidobacteraceae bacterium]|jgi:hypothetical protein
MDTDHACTGDVRPEKATDPRMRLLQEKYFTQRPKPLERWLWRQRISATAERVFWFHWSEGARNGNWCSQFALHFIAHQCEVDASTVTRAYQSLKRLGVIRRTDPGRDAGNPFQQATCITEVILPPEVLAELAASPNRGAPRLRVASCAPAPVTPASRPCPDRPPHPHEHLDLKQRRVRLKELGAALSPSEQKRWNKAICGTARSLDFDPDTRVPEMIQREIQQYLAAREPPKDITLGPRTQASTSTVRPRRLSVFDVARLRHGLQQIVGLQDADELTRQVLWSIETGSLRQFGVMHGINIALKKIREGHWSRPHRMPPNWIRKLSEPAQPETCGGA